MAFSPCLNLSVDRDRGQRRRARRAVGSLWIPPPRNRIAEIQLDPSFYLWSCSGVLPLPWGKLRTQHRHRDRQTDPIWTHRCSRLTDQHSYTGTGTHGPQHQRTHIHNRQKPQDYGTQTKCRLWGRCIDRARVTWGGGPLMTSPGIGTNEQHTDRQMSPASQPACHRDT